MTDFWYGKRILITGGDGFVAANLTRELLARGAVVTVVSRHQRPFPTAQLLDNSELLPDIELSDLTDFIQVQKICNRHQIDTIFHLAASAIVSDAANSPMSTFQNNIIPTLNLLDVARINKIPRVLIASTDKSYGDHADISDPEPLPYKEDHALRGMDVYSASKVCTDILAQTYSYQFGLPSLIVRSCNIYGPGDMNFTRLIPRTTLRLLAGKAPVINDGNANVLREYIYVDDVVGAYLFLAENMDRYYQQGKPKTGRATYGWGAFNVGSYTADDNIAIKDFENIRSVSQVINKLANAIGSEVTPKTIPKPDNFIEIPDQYLDSSKLMAFGFKPTIGFDEGIEKTISWYTANAKLLTKLGAPFVLS